MNKPLTRRLFGKAMAALPLAVQNAAATAAPALAQAELAGQMATAGVSMAYPSAPPAYGSYLLSNPRIWAMWKAGLAPEWVLNEIDNEIRKRSRHIDPDIVTMKSISLAAKVRMNHGKICAKITSHMERTSLLDQARRAFWEEENRREQAGKSPHTKP